MEGAKDRSRAASSRALQADAAVPVDVAVVPSVVVEEPSSDKLCPPPGLCPSASMSSGSSVGRTSS
eukprot:156318-Lingulodinium_polyedra.AAC.1